jgi:small subunit ribosomal protein S8
MIKDIFGDRLTRIRNRLRLKSSIVEIRKNRITHALAQILIKDNLIQEIIESIPLLEKKIRRPSLLIRLKYIGVRRISTITNLKRISRPSLRVYSASCYIPRILDGFGSSLISTSRGLMMDRDAIYNLLGGEVSCAIWLFFIFY